MKNPPVRILTSLENTVLELYGLNQNDVLELSSDRSGDLVLIRIKLKPHPSPCPVCGREDPVIESYIEKRINARCVILYQARRWKCKTCHRTHYERNPFVFKKQRISYATVVCILNDLRDPNATFSSIAGRYHISPTTVQHIFDDHVHVPRATTLPRVLQIDETYSFKSTESKYVCMLLDYDSQKAVDLLPTRKKADLLEYFGGFPAAERAKVKFIATDMYDIYRIVCKKMFPNAIYACDRFHVMQELSRKVQDVRCRVMKGARKGTDEYYLLKRHHKLLGIRPDTKKKIKNPDPYAKKKDVWVEVFDPNGNRTYNPHFKKYMNEHELLDLLLCIDEDLYEAYEIRNEMSRFFREATRENASEKLEKILEKLNRSQVQEMNAFGRTVANWFREIVNSFEIVKTDYMIDRNTGKAKRKDYRLTSSMIENRNEIVQQIRSNANGYSNWTRFRNRVLYVLNKLPFLVEPRDDDDDKNAS